MEVACPVTIGAPTRPGRVAVVGAYGGWAVDTGSDTGPFPAIGDSDHTARSDADRLVSELYAAHYAGLVRLAALLLRDHAVAEEAVQDAFVSLHRRWRWLRDTRNAAAYLRTSVIHNTRSIQRRRAVAARHPDDVLLDAPSAESGAIRAVSSRAVVDALHLLPRRQREALVLRYYADLSEAEIAEAMKISKGAVKSHTSRGMAALRANLEQWA
jgi:RNA polymerase sigma-70 factor (sigma-E family)